MECTATQRLSPVLRRLLVLDATFEAIAGVALLGVLGSPHVWLDVSRGVAIAAAVVFFAAAMALALAAACSRTTQLFVRYLAFANVAGGMVLWAVALLRWDTFPPEGLWLISAAADAFLLLAILEFVALRRLAAND